ncbi:hypothetical protein HWC53_gp086 [Bacillus phage vB_BmeM-Goe8]|uniref:Uncharacterized protein n=1 Tax=Bacillus phage vB_BmeM-Goe8 TaxID=2593638 RepID=A0A516KN49_9CAUD|nr:hypothetical protein HWC53_gp086 [Bacillus phage vB_BmeM-Goe8]QDP43003.1 hypothetical protein Goe8_c02300 [Bacillus phage vB_BmeM-Goe8]
MAEWKITEELALKIIDTPAVELPKTERELKMEEAARQALAVWRKNKEEK